ncbi:MAG: hydroxymethylbilane synthase [Flavobacteriales bacterium]
MNRKIIIGSRGSDLALWQARFFQSEMKRIGIETEIKIITTKGDRIQDLSFDKIEGKGFFTKEIEAALLDNEIDIAIHSHKDLETRPTPGLTIAGVSYRENPAELLLIHPESVDQTQLLGFKPGAIIGTSSARRKSQIKALRPDIEIKDIRGNVPTRINKLREKQFDAILLAAAGVQRLRLDLRDLIAAELDPRMFIPAPAQGVLAYQCRSNDGELIQAIQPLHHRDVQQSIAIERAILSGFGGGCHIPIGVSAQPRSTGFAVRVTYGNDWNDMPKRMRFNATSVEEATQVFADVQSLPVPNRVLITRKLEPHSYLKRAAQAFGFELCEKPFIRINHLPFKMPDVSSFDWVFFSSSNGVSAFLEHVSFDTIKHKKIAAFGEATARTLSNYVDHIDFTAKIGQPEEVAQEFASFIGEETALFPSSTISIKSIASCLKPSQVTHIGCYETQTLISSADDYDAYIFTSPSNVGGFIESGNQIAAPAKVIAIGRSTADRLSSIGIPAAVADIPHEAELLALLLS